MGGVYTFLLSHIKQNTYYDFMSKLISIVISLFFALTVAEESGVSSDVVVLTTENFEHLTQAATGATTGDWLIEFYAPWCGHCKKLQPIWEELATKMKGEVNIAKVDCTANHAVGDRFDIKGFPTIKFLHHGLVFDYGGPRKLESLVDFVTNGYKEKPSITVPLDKTLMDKIKKPFIDGLAEFNKGNYFAPEVIVMVLPGVVFVFMMLSLYFIGNDDVSTTENVSEFEKENKDVNSVGKEKKTNIVNKKKD